MRLPAWAQKQIEKLLDHGYGTVRLLVRDGKVVRVIASPTFAVTEKGPVLRQK